MEGRRGAATPRRARRPGTRSPTWCSGGLDVPIPDNEFIPIAEGYEVARHFTTDGVHQLHGTAPFGVAVVGYDYADSYAYLGGTGTGKINADPQG